MIEESREASRKTRSVWTSILLIIGSVVFLLISGCSLVFFIMAPGAAPIELAFLLPSLLVLYLIYRWWRATGGS